MKYFFMMILFLGVLKAQVEDPALQTELEDPDEQVYFEALLQRIFHPLEIDLADSIALDGMGFSEKSILLIMEWQESGATISGYKRLKKKLMAADVELLAETQFSKDTAAKIAFRQRLQYSATLDGWRILSKGRVHWPGLDVILLMEQDPGEGCISDHHILTISTDRIPGIDRVTVGDFHLSLGSGLMLNQTSTRISYSPGSLVHQPRLRVTPHYSTRETGYYHGFAVEWRSRHYHTVAFASSRLRIGSSDSGVFREDLDGIHPSGKSYDSQTQQIMGLAGNFEYRGMTVYLAGLYDLSKSQDSNFEVGLQWQVGETQLIQLFTDKQEQLKSRSIIAWSYKLKSVQLAAQYRYLPVLARDADASVIRLLGSSATSEAGLSFRLQVRPRKKMVLRYTLDTGSSAQLTNLSDLREVVQQKAQIQLSGRRGWQFEWGHKEAGPEIPEDVWQMEPSHSTINKFAVSLRQDMTSTFQYCLNLKVASNTIQKSILVQQRFLWGQDGVQLAVGLARYAVPESELRLSIYESNVKESFSFFTAYHDGQRAYIYIRKQVNHQSDVEARLSQTQSFESLNSSKQLEASFQLSVVF